MMRLSILTVKETVSRRLRLRAVEAGEASSSDGLNARYRRRLARTSRRAFSLAEVIVGSMVLAMFMLGLPLAVRMARNAVPDGTNTPSSTMTASRMMDVITADLAFATSVSSTAKYDPNHITFTVPDRNGDGQQETISYACDPPAPVKGQPPPPPGTKYLTRTYNGTATTLLTNVEEFNLTYDTIAGSQSTNAGTPQQLMTISSGTGLTTDGVSATHWIGQYFQPVLPAGAVSWNLTSVGLQVEKGLVKDVATVKLMNAVGDLPGLTVIDTSPQNASNLSLNYTWQNFAFSNANNLSPSAGLFVIVTSPDASASANIQHCSNSSGSGGYVSSSNSGATWTPNSSCDLMLQVSGTINTAQAGKSSTYYLNDVRCKLRTNQNNNSRVVTTVRTYNQPQAPHQ